MTERRFPIGIQTFSEIIRGEYVYVDKTDLVWKLQRAAKYIFLSRPRRFGKSLLSTTLESYFRGEKELFEGLKIMELEQDWKEYPVIRLDLSTAKGQDSPESLQHTLMWILSEYENEYGHSEKETTPGKFLTGIIQRAYEKTGRQVAVIIDEYDAPLLEVLHTKEMLDGMRRVMQEFYVPLKANERFLRFCFITGITKFSQLSSHTPTRTHGWTFSTINNLKNVSMLPQFSAICGITEEEVKTTFREDIERMSIKFGCSEEAMFAKIKERYDGYHFASVSEDIYNPFSLLNAFADEELHNYWFSTASPTFLIRQLLHFRTDITALDHLEVPSSAFDQPTENMHNALPLLYQSGYLTIKDYNRDIEAYTLSIPNQEVRIGYVRGLLPIYAGLHDADVQMGFAAKFWLALKKDDIDQGLQELQAYLSGIPYVDGFKKKLADAASVEGFYEYTLYLIFSMLNVYVRTQVRCAQGRADIIVFMPDTIYVMELKVNDTAENALKQIEEKGYDKPYLTDGRKIVKAGVHFDIQTRTVDNWVIA